jgi:hypothetical protein
MLAFALVAFFLAAASLLHPGWRFALFALNSLGIALEGGLLSLSSLSALSLFGKKRKWRDPALLAFLPVLLLFALQIPDALLISPYWDPLHYHLVLPRLWWERGGIYFPDQAIATYQGGGFELLYLWPHFFFAQAGGKGLLPVQIFGQLTHLVFGFAASIAIAWALIERWLPTFLWRVLALTLFAGVRSLQFSVPTAKCDWGVILLVLAGFWILAYGEKRKKTEWKFYLAGGVMWGFAWLAKLSSGYAIAALGLPLLLFSRLRPKQLTLLAFGFFLGALPLVLRNLLGTGNPIWPMLADLFPTKASSLGPTWVEALSHFRGVGKFGLRLREWCQESPLALLSPLGLLLALPGGEKDAGLRAACVAPIAGLFLFVLTAGAATEMRLAGALLPLAALAGSVLLEIGIRKFRSSSRLPGVLLALSALALPYNFSSWQRLGGIARPEQLASGYIGAFAQRWFREHYKPGMKLAMIVDVRTYHSIPLPVILVWDYPRLDAKIQASPDVHSALEAIRTEGFTHLLISQEKFDLFYSRKWVADIESYVLARPDSFVFHTPYSIIASVDSLLTMKR